MSWRHTCISCGLANQSSRRRRFQSAHTHNSWWRWCRKKCNWIAHTCFRWFSNEQRWLVWLEQCWHCEACQLILRRSERLSKKWIDGKMKAPTAVLFTCDATFKCAVKLFETSHTQAEHGCIVKQSPLTITCSTFVITSKSECGIAFYVQIHITNLDFYTEETQWVHNLHNETPLSLCYVSHQISWCIC